MTEGDPAPSGGLGELFSKFKEAQAELEEQAEAMHASVVEGSAAGGAVVVRISGALEAESVHIDSSLIHPADLSLVEDAVLAALRDALGKVVTLRSSLAQGGEDKFPAGVDLDSFVGGIDLGGLLGGVDVNALMANFGLDLSALGALEVGDDADDAEEGSDTLADDEPGA